MNKRNNNKNNINNSDYNITQKRSYSLSTKLD